MQMVMTRTEIRAHMRSLMGQQTTEAVSGISFNQFNAAIDLAYRKAVGDSPWVQNESRTTVDLGVGQYKIAYPAGCAPGSIKDMAIADPADGQYLPMEGRHLPVVADFDLIEAMGGDEFQAIQGIPEFWQQRKDFVYLYPPNNQTARKVRLQTFQVLKFTDETTNSVCDGELIAMWALAVVYGDHDPAQRAFYQGLYVDRKGLLTAWAHTNEAVTFREDSPVLDQYNGRVGLPNWDTRPRSTTP